MWSRTQLKSYVINKTANIIASVWDHIKNVIIWIKLFVAVTCGCTNYRTKINITSQYSFNIRKIYCSVDDKYAVAPKKYSNLLRTFWTLPYIDKNIAKFKEMLHSFGLSDMSTNHIHIIGRINCADDFVVIRIIFNLKDKNYIIDHYNIYNSQMNGDTVVNDIRKPKCTHNSRFSMGTFDIYDIMEPIIGNDRCETLESF